MKRRQGAPPENDAASSDGLCAEERARLLTDPARALYHRSVRSLTGGAADCDRAREVQRTSFDVFNAIHVARGQSRGAPFPNATNRVVEVTDCDIAYRGAPADHAPVGDVVRVPLTLPRARQLLAAATTRK